MKIERTKNSIKGIISGFINKAVLLILPFFVKTIFINTLGMRYFGLNGLFANILNILNLAELGIGSAITFSMYNAIAQNDKDKICALENLYKKAYRIIGIIIFLVGILIMPVIKFICNGDIPSDINIYILYFLFLINTVFSYLFFAYKSSILVSHQQSYIINNVSTIVNIFMNIFQAVALLLGQSYYFYVILSLLATIIMNIINYIIVNKKYPNYKPRGDISKGEKKEIYNKIKALFFYRIGSVVLTSVDSIVITYFLGLTELGKYNSYYYVITTLFGFFQIFNASLLAGVGNSIAADTKEKNKQDFDRLNFLLGWIVGFCSICLLCLYQQFIYLWIGPKNMFSFGVVICLSIYFYVWKMLEIINLYKDAIGLWERDKYRPLISAIVNLILNIILVQIIGIYGIIISTIVSIIIVIFPWSTYILFKEYFKTGYKKYLKDYFINLVVTVFIALITYLVCSYFYKYNILYFLINIVICTFLPNILYFMFYFHTDIFKDSYAWLKQKILRRHHDT